ncbi:MAG: rhomboid family intramembrane serine protease [Polyangiaceae bacterium]|nr:rhomboid family intramembrane serine protease [Polyangiaceae bacterium]
MFLPLADINPTFRRPAVTHGLIVANVTAWVWQLLAMSRWGELKVVYAYGLVPLRLLLDLEGGLSTLITSMFMHGSTAHLVGNMLFLHIFGDNVEEALGRRRFLAFYLGSGLVAGLAQVAVDPASTVPMVGASGAVAGVLGAYLVLHPRAPILVLNTFLLPWPLLTFPAWLAIGMWFLLNLLGGFASLGMGHGAGVAHFAHLGGFAAGLVAIRLCMAGRSCRPVDPWAGWRPPPRPQGRRFRIDSEGVLQDPREPPDGRGLR